MGRGRRNLPTNRSCNNVHHLDRCTKRPAPATASAAGKVRLNAVHKVSCATHGSRHVCTAQAKHSFHVYYHFYDDAAATPPPPPPPILVILLILAIHNVVQAQERSRGNQKQRWVGRLNWCVYQTWSLVKFSHFTFFTCQLRTSAQPIEKVIKHQTTLLCWCCCALTHAKAYPIISPCEFYFTTMLPQLR